MSTLPAVIFGTLLRRYRLAAGLSQEELAERARLSREAISTLERGTRRVPRKETVDLLAAALQLSPAEHAQLEAVARGRFSETSSAAPRSPSLASDAARPLMKRIQHLTVLEQPINRADKLSVMAERIIPALPQPTARQRLPIPPTPLIGREQEVRAMCTLLQRPAVRLLTLSGTAGVGKTRLALQVASDLGEAFADGVQFIPLAALRDPDLVLPTIAYTLGVLETGDQPILARLEGSLRGQHLLLVLDNFEQVIPAATHLAALLEGCPGLKLLVTSRQVLSLRAEHQFVVPPLALPVLPTHNATLPLDPETLARQPAAQLFVQRVQAIKSDFQVTNANARAIAEICQRLDGLPLAIELAAARIKVLSPQALLARLEHRLQVLTGGARDLPERQQTLRATIAWSYELLGATEQQLFRRLAIFAGGCTLEAAEALCAALDGDTKKQSVMDDVTSLIDKSLVRQTEQEGEAPRLSMLETLREYGLECLHERGEAMHCQQAQARYVLARAEEAESHLKSARQVEWLRQLGGEQGNIRAALGWFIEQEEGDLALRLAGALWRFWFMRGSYSEGYHWLEAALGLPQRNLRTATRAKALCGAGWLSSFLQGGAVATRLLLEESAALSRELGDKGILAEALSELAEGIYRREDTAAARALFEECVELARAAGDPWLLAMSLRTLGWFAYDYDPGNLERAAHLLEESMALSRALGDTWGLSRVLKTLSHVALSQGKATQAAALAQENLTLARELDNKVDMVEGLCDVAVATLFQGDAQQAAVLLQESIAHAREMGDTEHSKDMIAFALLLLGRINTHQSHLEQAISMLEQSLALFRAVGFKDSIALALAALGEVSRVQGDLEEARALCTEGEFAARELGYHAGIGRNRIGLAKVAADAGHFQQAARLFATAASWVNPSVELDPFERADYERAVEKVREDLGEKVFTALWDEGRDLTPEQAVAASESALTARPSHAPGNAAPTYPNDLTQREVEVLRLLAQDLTNVQIARQLVISPYTVNNHVRSILSKLSVTSRTGATRFALEHHLL